MRRALAERDGPGCAYCGNDQHPIDTYRLEHVVPYSRGGPNTIENRVLACERCDIRKANRTPQEWQPGKVWGNPVIDTPTINRRKRTFLYASERRAKRRAEEMTGADSWYTPLSSAQADAARRRDRQAHQEALARKGVTTVAWCVTEGKWVRVAGHPKGHLLLDDASNEP
jgi:hypothetical protein